MPSATWGSLPTQYVEHNSILGADTDRHVVRKVSRFLNFPDEWTITAENVDPSDAHLQSVTIEDGDLYFHTGTVTNRTIEEISLTATNGTDSINETMLIVIDPPTGAGQIGATGVGETGVGETGVGQLSVIPEPQA